MLFWLGHLVLCMLMIEYIAWSVEQPLVFILTLHGVAALSFLMACFHDGSDHCVCGMQSSHQIVETEHLMKALLEQPNGLARRILAKAGSNPTELLDKTDAYIRQQPRISGDSQQVGLEACNILNVAVFCLMSTCRWVSTFSLCSAKDYFVNLAWRP